MFSFASFLLLSSLHDNSPGNMAYSGPAMRANACGRSRFPFDEIFMLELEPKFEAM